MNDVRITVRDLHKRYADHWVLQGISFQVRRAEIACLIGPSGSGKSTLLRTLNGLASFDSGSIDVCGLAVGRGADPRQLRRHVGMVFQSYNLFPHLTVERNITLALTTIKKMSSDEAKSIAHKVLTLVGLDNKKEAYPEQLSGGQAQRVAIARSLAMAPELMLFDEVTSALDPELTSEVLKVMEDLAKQGMTMVLVTHEMAFARKLADVLVFMHHGQVWEVGPPDELFSNPKTAELQKFVASDL